jgi:hypothetical protein
MLPFVAVVVATCASGQSRFEDILDECRRNEGGEVARVRYGSAKHLVNDLVRGDGCLVGDAVAAFLAPMKEFEEGAGPDGAVRMRPLALAPDPDPDEVEVHLPRPGVRELAEREVEDHEAPQAAVRIHGATRERPVDRLELERAALCRSDVALAPPRQPDGQDVDRLLRKSPRARSLTFATSALGMRLPRRRHASTSWAILVG